jgi:hypothetical protein
MNLILGDRMATLNSAQLEAVMRYRSAIVGRVASWTSVRKYAEAAGAILFNGLFANANTRDKYRDGLSEIRSARQRGGGQANLHIKLRLAERSSAKLPWEFLYDPQEGMFLAASNYISIERQPTGVKPENGAPPRRPPFRILIVLSTPATSSRPHGHSPRHELPFLDTLEFYRCLKQLRRNFGGDVLTFDLLAGPDATQERLQAALSRPNGYDAFYFLGHSLDTDGVTWLQLEDGTCLRRAVPLDSAVLGGWLQAANIRKVFLSSCESLTGASRLAALTHVESVMGMQMEMPLLSAALFDQTVLRGLVVGESAERCVQLGRQRIQQFLRAQNDPCIHEYDRPDWAIPVLFTRYAEFELSCCQVPAGRYPIGLSAERLRAASDALGDALPEWLASMVRSSALVDLQEFRLSRWPITNLQFRWFLEQVEREVPRKLLSAPTWHPAVEISWAEAEEYCRWVGGRLPSADEWEAAARGPMGLIFPWGDNFDAKSCSPVNSPAGSKPVHGNGDGGASSLGCEDMCGNVFEWTATGDSSNRCVLGGSWRSPAAFAIPSLRARRNPSRGYEDVGFRVAFAPQPCFEE